MDLLTIGLSVGLVFALEIIYTIYHFWVKHQRQKSIHSNWGSLTMGDFSPDELSFIKEQTELHNGTFAIDDITWNDLDMNEIYQQMNACFSASGDQILYHFLRNPLLDKTALAKRKQIIEWAKQDEYGRNVVRSSLSKIDSRGMIAIDALYNDSTSTKTLSAMMTILFSLLPIVFFIAGFFFPLLMVYSILICFVNCFLAYTYHKGMADDFESSLYLYGYVQSIQALSKANIDATVCEHYDIKRIAKSLSSIKRSLFPDMHAGDDLFCLIISNFFLGELFTYYRLRGHLIKHRESIEEAIGVMGELDAFIAIASYMDAQPIVCWANFIDKPTMVAKTMVHPLLKNPVPNDVNLQSNVLISGSNASGKSTYLKMIAINNIFSQSFGFALAKSYQAGLFQLFTSMSLKDSISEHDSYFVAEIKSIKRILDHTRDDTPILCMIDEILRGTNTGERIAAASEVLLTLHTAGALSIAATHDIELTHILSNHYFNCHFTETFKDSQMQFDYQIHDGISHSRNALSLLNSLSFDPAVVSEAEEQLQYYEQHGIWKNIGNEVDKHEK